MGQLTFQATLGGQVNLVGPNTASTYNINVPATSGNMVTTGDSATVTSGMLASTTGSGAVVLATSPALVSPTLPSGTANGVAYLNGSKVVTTGSALTFDGTGLGIGTGTIPGGRKLVISAGNIRLDSDYQIEWGGSTVGLYGNGSTNSLSFFANTSEQMRLTSTGLGIGTSSPAAKLDVQVAGVGIQLKQSSTGSATYYVMDNTVETGGKRWRFGYTGAAGVSTFSLYNATDGVTSLVADSSGNLGIGTTANASAILDAQSTTKGVRMPNMTTTQKNAIASPAAGLMVFDTTLAKLCVYTGAAWQTITST